jgi:hypothetical protein
MASLNKELAVDGNVPSISHHGTAVIRRTAGFSAQPCGGVMSLDLPHTPDATGRCAL